MSRNQQDSLKFFRNTALWPNMALPVKRSVAGKLETAVLMEKGYFGSGKLNFVKGNIWNLTREQVAAAVEVTPEQLIADGWIVD